MNLIKLTLATLIFVMSFAMQSNEAEADCPSGTLEEVMQIQYPGSDCIYEIKFCYHCDFTPSPNYNIAGFEVYPINYETADCNNNFNNVVDWAFSLAIERYLELCSLSPCDVSFKTITALLPLCKKTQNVIWNIPNDPSIYNFSFERLCKDGGFYCLREIDICYDLATEQYITLDTRYTTVGTPCQLKVYVDIPPSGKTYNDSWQTECYYEGETCP